MKKLISVILISIVLFSCKKDNNNVTTSDDATKTTIFDCLPSNSKEFIVPGDPYQTNPNFYGYADPSIRKDVSSNTIWLAYSFPHYELSGTTQVGSVSIHLAKSVDNGNSWSLVKTLFNSTPMNNPANTSQSGFLDHEVINLLPVKQGTQSFWLAARLNYFVPAIGGFSARPNNSFYISILKASTPDNLDNGEIATIGGNLTHQSWNVNTRLIPTELTSDYFFWNEPALYYDDVANKLYLIMVAFVYTNGSPDMPKNETYVYSTTPNGSPNTWTWDYKGKLISSSIANELGAQRLSQVDISKGIDGKLLLICSPDDWNSAGNDFNHKGCKVIEIKSLETPSLERDSKGKLRIRVSITASDANDLGSAASSYDPNSETGILFTKRIKTPNNLTTNIWKTKIKP